jgi:DNA polymerase (family 10)
VKGFGAKTEAAILANIGQAAEHAQRISIADARAAAESIVADLRLLPEVTACETAGSCRRRRETCGDLDVLAVCTDSTIPMDRLAAHPLVDSVLQRGETKQRVRLKTGVELDLRVVPEESFWRGHAVLHGFKGAQRRNSPPGKGTGTEGE